MIFFTMVIGTIFTFLVFGTPLLGWLTGKPVAGMTIYDVAHHSSYVLNISTWLIFSYA